MTLLKNEKWPRAAALSGVALCVLWAYWTTLASMAEQWDRDPEYNHGWLVPFFAVALIWMRRDQAALMPSALTKLGAGLMVGALAAWMLIPVENFPWVSAVAAGLGVVGGSMIISDSLPANTGKGSWAALLLLVIAAALRVGSAYYYFEWFDRLSLVAVAVATVPLVLGTGALRRTWPALCFLIFMVPLPYRLEVAMRDPLRRIGTEVTTYAMQTMGVPAFSEGNVIVIPQEGPESEGAAAAHADPEAAEAVASHEIRIGVVEACSGLRMLMVFVALSSAMALITVRPLWQKAILLAAAVPIALASNILRILATGLMRIAGWDHLADLAFHDLAGWLMMPVGLLLLGALFWFMDRIFVVEEDRPMAVGLNITPAAAADSRELQGALR